MGEPSEVRPVKRIAALLWRNDEVLERACALLQTSWEGIDYRSPVFPFEVTRYYESELGRPIRRGFVSFARLADPAGLADWKLESNRIEGALAVDGKRVVNIDVGYLDVDKVVLASVKSGPYKVYLCRGVWADMVLHYEKGTFHPFPWGFADFRSADYEKVFLRIREIYKRGLKGTSGER